MKLELSTVKWHINNIDPNNARTSRNELMPSVAKMRHDFSDNQKHAHTHTHTHTHTHLPTYIHIYIPTYYDIVDEFYYQ